MSEPIDQRIDVGMVVVAGTCCEDLAFAEDVGVDPYCSPCGSSSWSSCSSLAGVSSCAPFCCPRHLVIAGDWRVGVLLRS